jgi:CheY-like chemotaxis protein
VERRSKGATVENELGRIIHERGVGVDFCAGRCIIESHDGRLSRAPSSAACATFTFAIPRRSEGSMGARGPSVTRAGRGHPNARHERPVIANPPLVSVVDDDESVRESLPDLLRELGFAAEAFPSAEAFLASDHLGRTRCLILDVVMPGMSGLELQAELTRRGHAIPIVFITAQQDDSIRTRVLAAGAMGYLFKPFSETALLDAVNAALGVSS